MGVRAFLRGLDNEVGPYGMTVSAWLPSITVPGMQVVSQESGGRVAQLQALHRTGKPEDIRSPLAFLTSDDARFILGQAIVADGGLYRSPNLNRSRSTRVDFGCQMLKIICFEEHCVDPAIASALREVASPETAYHADWGSRVQDRPADPTRPRLIAGDASLKLALDMGAGRIEAMDEAGIDVQILSYSNPTQFAPVDRAVRLAEAANDRLADAVRAYPTRFGGFATLPWQNPSAAAKELERAVKQLGLSGALIPGRPGKAFLDDPQYEPVLQMLAELQVPLYIHPGLPLTQVREPYYGGLDKEVSARLSLFGWGWHNEAGVHVLRLLLAGVFDRIPKLQVISGHWGEMVPFYLQRLDDAIPQEASRLSRTITDTYRQHVYVTPSGMLQLPHFEFIRTVIGSDRILYSVDYPYLTLAGSRSFLESLPVSQNDKEKIASGNAEKLLMSSSSSRSPK